MKNLISILQIASIIFALAACTYESVATEIESKICGEGDPIIFIPGLTCPGEVWDGVIDHYKGKYECHVLSLPGFGGTKPIDVSNGFLPIVSEDIKSYIKKHHLRKPVIIGHSLGGFLGLKLSSETSDLIGGLVVVDSLPFLTAIMNPMATEDSSRDMARGIVASMENRNEDQIRMMLASMITAPSDVDTALEWSSQSDLKTVQQATYELYTTDLRDDIQSIKIKTLVLGAWVGYKNFGATRESTEFLYNAQYQNHPNYELKMTDKGKHFIMWDDSEFFYQTVDQYLTEIQKG